MTVSMRSKLTSGLSSSWCDTTYSITCAPFFGDCGDPVSYQGYDYTTVLSAINVVHETSERELREWGFDCRLRDITCRN